MLTIKSPSDQPCFVCGSTENVRVVKFEDKSFSGNLCMRHIAEKTDGKAKPTKEKSNDPD